jgi:hypothetical protein
MQFTILASVLAASGLVAASPLSTRDTGASCPAQSGASIRKITNFSGRKHNGKDFNSIVFTIESTLSAGNPQTCEIATPMIEDNVFYPCSPGSDTYFAWDSISNALALKTKPTNNMYVQSHPCLHAANTNDCDSIDIATTTVDAYCHAGGDGPDDIICNSLSDSYITWVMVPSGTA